MNRLVQVCFEGIAGSEGRYMVFQSSQIVLRSHLRWMMVPGKGIFTVMIFSVMSLRFCVSSIHQYQKVNKYRELLIYYKLEQHYPTFLWLWFCYIYPGYCPLKFFCWLNIIHLYLFSNHFLIWLLLYIHVLVSFVVC